MTPRASHQDTVSLMRTNETQTQQHQGRHTENKRETQQLQGCCTENQNNRSEPHQWDRPTGPHAPALLFGGHGPPARRWLWSRRRRPYRSPPPGTCSARGWSWGCCPPSFTRDELCLRGTDCGTAGSPLASSRDALCRQRGPSCVAACSPLDCVQPLSSAKDKLLRRGGFAAAQRAPAALRRQGGTRPAAPMSILQGAIKSSSLCLRKRKSALGPTPNPSPPQFVPRQRPRRNKTGQFLCFDQSQI